MHQGQGVKFAKVQFRTLGGDRNFVWSEQLDVPERKRRAKTTHPERAGLKFRAHHLEFVKHVNKDLTQAASLPHSTSATVIFFLIHFGTK